MSTFEEKLKEQLERQETIQHVLLNFSKENRFALKKVPRLQSWYKRIYDLWVEFRTTHDELTTFEQEFISSEYFTQHNIETIQAKVGAMKEKIEKILEKLGKPITSDANSTEMVSPIQIEDSVIEDELESNEESEQDSEQDEQQHSTQIGDERNEEFKTPKAKPTFKKPRFNLSEVPEADSVVNDNFRTPCAKPSILLKTPKVGINEPFPRHIMKNPELTKIAEETVGRFKNKMRRFSNELNNIEKYMADGLLSKARLTIKDIEKRRIDLDECIEELTFMLGDRAQQYEDDCDILTEKYRDISDMVGAGEKGGERKGALKLKPIEIPKFSGSIKNWTTFSGLFKTMVIDDASYKDIERMQYLKTSITGEAAKLISTMDISPGNFERAWAILVNRYENKRAIRNTYVETMLELPTITKESSMQLRESYDKSKECVELLSNVSKEQIILYILIKKLPNETRKVYEQSLTNPTAEQKLEEYFDFLHKRCQILESIEGNNVRRFEKTSVKEKCACCNDVNHPIFMCDRFKKLTIAERRDIVKNKSLCLLCLKSNPKHMANECRFKKMCPTCGKRHNGLLHEERPQISEKKPSRESTKKSFFATTEENVMCAMSCVENNGTTVLATALIRVKMTTGYSELIRVLIDQGSMTSFISERAVRNLKLQRQKTNLNIHGIAGTVEAAKGQVEIEIAPRYPSSFKIGVNAIVMSKLTTVLPSNNVNKATINTGALENLIFADPRYNMCGKIDMILGADVYSSIILGGLIKPDDKSFVVQETELGWIISGRLIKGKQDMGKIACMTASISELDEAIQRFWQLEKMPNEPVLTEEDQECMKHFNSTVLRNSDGVYVVSLPFKKGVFELGNTKKMAMAQYLQLERKFQREPELKILYMQYMNELIERGFLKKCDQRSKDRVFYLPHHAVLKDSTTTKVRPVYNASQKSSNGMALNDVLMKGPKLQQDIFNIMLRFRVNKIAFTADIEKMYLHVRLNENDQDLQRILLRTEPNGPIEDYVLTTVTFGMNCSPFLAVAVIQHHAKQLIEKYPEACRVILEDSYMDDISSGCETLNEAIELQRNVTAILAEASFPLRKWVSNSNELMKCIPESDKEGAGTKTDHGYQKFVSTLGLRWLYESDKISCKMTNKASSNKMTKRSILSEIASIYDPLGLLAPITIYNKIIMQNI